MRKCMKEKLINSFDSPLSIIPSSEDIYNKALKDQEFKKRQNIIDMYLRKYVLPAIEQAISLYAIPCNIKLRAGYDIA